MPAALYELHEKLDLLRPGIASALDEIIQTSDTYVNHRPFTISCVYLKNLITKVLEALSYQMRDGVHVPMAGLVCCLFHRIELLILDSEDLRIVARLELSQPSIARLSADENNIYVVGDHCLIRVFWNGESLKVDESFNARYRTLEGQTFGWDTVITDDDA